MAYTVIMIGTVTFTGNVPACAPRQYSTTRFAFFRCLFARLAMSRIGDTSSTRRGKPRAIQHRAVTRLGLGTAFSERSRRRRRRAPRLVNGRVSTVETVFAVFAFAFDS